MSTMTSSQSHIGCLVLNVALGKDGKAFQTKIEHYLSKNGVEWTNNRLKVIWNAALLLRNQDFEGARTLYQQNSISYRKSTFFPKGIEGRVVRRFVEAQRPVVIKRIAAAMRYYCSLTVEQLTPKQRHKALNAITGVSTCDREGANLLGRMDLHASLEERKIEFKTLDEAPLKGNEIHAEHLKATSKYFSRYSVPKDLRGTPYSSMAMSFMTEPWIPHTLDKVVPCYEMRDHIRHDSWYIDNPQQYAGKIVVIQEQGCKARVVALLTAWLQLAFMPLHNRIARMAETLFPKESCVREQPHGAYTMLAHLRNGKSVYCTDLSSATDRFPRDYTLGVLEALGYQSYATALREVCNQPFKCDFSPSGEVRYEVGQPMGLYGSFPMFHLSNMLMADAAVRKAKSMYVDFVNRYVPDAFPDGTYFKTVGDDIIFSDGEVAKHYRKAMQHLGVQISESKSFSGQVAEFAGFIGLKTNKSEVAFRPYKVPVGDTINNTLQFLDALGSKVSKISPWWAKQFKAYSYTIGSRDLALEPIVKTEDNSRIQTSNRGDNRTLVNLCNAIACVSEEPLPDLSGSTKINRVPLFRERGMFDFYGFNPSELVREEKETRKEPMRAVRKSLSQDPLIQAVRDIQAGRVESDPRLLSNPKTSSPLAPADEQGVEQVGDTSKLANEPLAKANEPSLDPKEKPPLDYVYWRSLGFSHENALLAEKLEEGEDISNETVLEL